MDKEPVCPYCGAKFACVYTRGSRGTEFECGTKVDSYGDAEHEGYDCDWFPGRDRDCYDREIARMKKKQSERDKLVDALTKAWDDFDEDADFKWAFGSERFSQELYDAVDNARSDLKCD